MCICVWMPVCSSVVNEWLEPSVLAVAARLVFKHLEKPEHRLGKGHTKKISQKVSGGSPPLLHGFFLFLFVLRTLGSGIK